MILKRRHKMKKTFKAKNTHVIVKQFKEMADRFEYVEDTDIDKLKYLDGTIIHMGKLVDTDEYELGDVVHCAKFTASKLDTNGHYAVDASDIMCSISYNKDND
jgi:hypothetical protein